jgi:hypothetical protein
MVRMVRIPAFRLLFSVGFFGFSLLVAGKFCLHC